jgi:protein-disulfide isomerase
MSCQHGGRLGIAVRRYVRHGVGAHSGPLRYQAALALECATRERDQHRLLEALYQQPLERNDEVRSIVREYLPERAVEIEACLSTEMPSANVRESWDAYLSLGAQGTPTIVVNDRLLVGFPGADDLRAILLAEMALVQPPARDASE